MGHRHLFTSSQMFEGEHDQNWNHMQTDHTYGHIAVSVNRAGSADNGPYYYPIESMFTDGIHFSPHWNPHPRPYSSSSQNVEVPPYQPDVSGPSHDPFQQHTVSAGTFSAVPENNVHHAPSSSYDRQTFQGVEASFVDLTMGNGRGPHKRKSPGVPSGCERGSTSRYYGTGPGSSSDLHMPSELCHEKVGLDSPPMPWDRVAMNPGYNRGNGLSIRAEESMRNVRSRSSHDLETNLSRTHLSSNSPHNAYAANHIDHPTSLDISSQSPAGLTLEWNHFGMPPNGNVLVSDSSVFGHEPTRFLLGNNPGNEGLHPDFTQNTRNVSPQSYPGPSAQSARGVRSSYSQRPNPTLRASSSNAGLRLGHPPTPPLADEGLHSVAESHSRHHRPLSNVGWRNGDRNGRSRISHDRYRLLADETSHDRLASEGFMIVDRSAMHGSRNALDQHREMRLDVDNMSYEELLALGERIGSVSTGVSADLMSKCVTETIYCSSDQVQDEETCVICLEEYKNMDDVGTLKSCGHDYHVECIKKWLEMKNMCPICKAPALPDKLKGKK